MQTSETSAEVVFLKGGIKAGIITPKIANPIFIF